jgi:hypothetical protein
MFERIDTEEGEALAGPESEWGGGDQYVQLRTKHTGKQGCLYSSKYE